MAPLLVCYVVVDGRNGQGEEEEGEGEGPTNKTVGADVIS